MLKSKIRLICFCTLVLSINLIPLIANGLESNIHGFSLEKTRILKQAAEEWGKVHPCGRPIETEPMEKTFDKQVSVTRETFEVSDPGKIKIYPELNDLETRNTILHSMTHACKNDTPTILKQSLIFSDGLILGYHGAGIIIQLKDGKKTNFALIEEAICERNASLFEKYSIKHRGYFAIGSLAVKHFSNTIAVMSLIRNNDIPRIAGIILNKPKEKIMTTDILQVMTLYQKAWDNNSPQTN